MGESHALRQLTDKLRANLSFLGYHDHQPFIPHITLARGVMGKTIEGLSSLSAMDDRHFKQLCDEFYLMENVHIQDKRQYRTGQK